MKDAAQRVGITLIWEFGDAFGDDGFSGFRLFGKVRRNRCSSECFPVDLSSHVAVRTLWVSVRRAFRDSLAHADVTSAGFDFNCEAAREPIDEESDYQDEDDVSSVSLDLRERPVRFETSILKAMHQSTVS